MNESYSAWKEKRGRKTGLLLKPGPGPWTRILDPTLDLDPGSGSWTQTLYPDPEKPGPWKTWETAGYGKMIRRPHIITY